ncbi:hypothetical protein [Mobiluncus curtisii]|uniref:Uncharacterized protein n=2 Tax=Mobiluncus curtisii TaxID=2051 RepID=D6ZJM8_MOBCV|nr:hypothetical protein [Mobiluncus curtisii]ADI66927.1 hypothetical protein HMPREF0573_10608 [Mobiluncus curtisii ATCC 43063]MCU9987280.1 hypothetical protein [Mobiluncus curtisii]MCV0001163.1 hypothetical protein [Mobiluncus curtisii]MCV0020240.1 hypothetical protein [Mobiluncus curtisii]NMW45286.1 hypothetical protein [Mobiluncus curtisii]
MEDSDLIRLATQLPVSQLGDQLLHLQPGSRLGLYLLELSNQSITPAMVATAEQALNRPLAWILSQLRKSCAGLDMQDFVELVQHPGPDLLDFVLPGDASLPDRSDGADLAAGEYISSAVSPQSPRREQDNLVQIKAARPHPSLDANHLPDEFVDALSSSLQAYFLMAVKSKLINLVGSQVMLSLMGIRQLRSPQPILPMVAFALSDSDEDEFFLRLIIGALAQAFASCDWAESTDPRMVAVDLLHEMGQDATPEAVGEAVEVFNNFLFSAGCLNSRGEVDLRAHTPIVLLQYLVSEALQPK